MIALCCDSQNEALYAMLSAFEETLFFSQDHLMKEYAKTHGHFRLIVVAMDGALGMNMAGYGGNGPVLWITEQADFLKESQRRNVVGFLAKPFTDDVFRETVAQILDGKASVVHIPNIAPQQKTIMEERHSKWHKRSLERTINTVGMKFAMCVPFMQGDIWVERLEDLGEPENLWVCEYTRPEDVANMPGGLWRFDAVWVVMDGAEGLEAVQLIREKHPHVRIVWISDDLQFGLIGYSLRVFQHWRNDCTDEQLTATIKRIKETPDDCVNQ